MIYSRTAIDALSSASSPPLDYSGEGASTIEIIPGSARKSSGWYGLADDDSDDSLGDDDTSLATEQELWEAYPHHETDDEEFLAWCAKFDNQSDSSLCYSSDEEDDDLSAASDDDGQLIGLKFEFASGYISPDEEEFCDGIEDVEVFCSNTKCTENFDLKTNQTVTVIVEADAVEHATEVAEVDGGDQPRVRDKRPRSGRKALAEKVYMTRARTAAMEKCTRSGRRY